MASSLWRWPVRRPPAAMPTEFRLNMRSNDCATMRCQIDANTMSDVLAQKAAEDPARTAYIFLDDRDGAVEMSYGELDRRARVIAARLQLELQRGDRALLVYPPGLDFIAAFFG